MAIACPTNFDTKTLRSEVASMYAGVAAEPDGKFHFHRRSSYPESGIGMISRCRRSLLIIAESEGDGYAEHRCENDRRKMIEPAQ